MRANYRMLFLGLLLGCCQMGSGQGGFSTGGDFWNRVSFGGGLGLGFANNSFNLAVSPNALYQASENFATGVGVNFNYAKFGPNKLVAYGASFINLYNAADWIQFSAEYEQWRVNLTQENTGALLRDAYWSPALFLGAGFRQGNVTFGLRYDVLFDEERSIYADPLMPFVRVMF